jgi:hypothetical protein
MAALIICLQPCECCSGDPGMTAVLFNLMRNKYRWTKIQINEVLLKILPAPSLIRKKSIAIGIDSFALEWSNSGQ